MYLSGRSQIHHTWVITLASRQRAVVGSSVSPELKAKFHYAIQVADLVCDLVCYMVADMDNVMEFGYS